MLPFCMFAFYRCLVMKHDDVNFCNGQEGSPGFQDKSRNGGQSEFEKPPGWSWGFGERPKELKMLIWKSEGGEKRKRDQRGKVCKTHPRKTHNQHFSARVSCPTFIWQAFCPFESHIWLLATWGYVMLCLVRKARCC